MHLYKKKIYCEGEIIGLVDSKELIIYLFLFNEFFHNNVLIKTFFLKKKFVATLAHGYDIEQYLKTKNL